jgi:hypothetical protein
VHVAPEDAQYVLTTTDNGFNNPNPVYPALAQLASGQFTDLGPGDLGASFDFQLPTSILAPTTFTLYYGAGKDAADAMDALSKVGVGTYALAKPGPDPVNGAPNTFAFGFRGPKTGP